MLSESVSMMHLVKEPSTLTNFENLRHYYVFRESEPHALIGTIIVIISSPRLLADSSQNDF
jgi:outer membrane protein assembly factor BamE (lipoprotein component of BamABCDE complex)